MKKSKHSRAVKEDSSVGENEQNYPSDEDSFSKEGCDEEDMLEDDILEEGPVTSLPSLQPSGLLVTSWG